MKSFMLALCFVVDLQATSGLTVAAKGKSLLSHKVSFESVHVSNEHDARVSKLMVLNPQATKELCDACVASEEDLVSNQTTLEDALRNLSSATQQLIVANTEYAQCLVQEVSLKNTLDSAETALRTRLDTANVELVSLTTMIASTLSEVNVPDPSSVVHILNPDKSYDGSGLLALGQAWEAAFNAHATKKAECDLKHENVQNATALAHGHNSTVVVADMAVATANATSVELCNRMKNGYNAPSPPAYGPKVAVSGITITQATGHYPSGDCGDTRHCKKSLMDGCTSYNSCNAHGSDREADMQNSSTYRGDGADLGTWFNTDCTGGTSGLDCSSYKSTFDSLFGAPASYKTGMVVFEFPFTTKVDEVCIWGDTSGSYFTQYMMPLHVMLTGANGVSHNWTFTLEDHPSSGQWMCEDLTSSFLNDGLLVTPASKLSMLVRADGTNAAYTHVAEIIIYGGVLGWWTPPPAAPPPPPALPPPPPLVPLTAKAALAGITVDAATGHYPSGDCGDTRHCKKSLMDGCTSYNSCNAHGSDREADMQISGTYRGDGADLGTWFNTDCTGGTSGLDCSSYKSAFEAEFADPGTNGYKTGMIKFGNFVDNTLLEELCIWGDTSGSYFTEYMMPLNVMIAGANGVQHTWAWTLSDYPSAGGWMCKDLSTTHFFVSAADGLTMLVRADGTNAAYTHLAEIIFYGRTPQPSAIVDARWSSCFFSGSCGNVGNCGTSGFGVNTYTFSASKCTGSMGPSASGGECLGAVQQSSQSAPDESYAVDIPASSSAYPTFTWQMTNKRGNGDTPASFNIGGGWLCSSESNGKLEGLTSCTVSKSSLSITTGFNYHQFTAAECSNGLPPSGVDCVTSLRSMQVAAEGDEDWIAWGAGESWSDSGAAVTGPAFAFKYSSSATSSAIDVVVDYLCPVDGFGDNFDAFNCAKSSTGSTSSLTWSSSDCTRLRDGASKTPAQAISAGEASECFGMRKRFLSDTDATSSYDGSNEDFRISNTGATWWPSCPYGVVVDYICQRN